MSGDKEQEYFSDGLAEEIINALTHVPGLKVTARDIVIRISWREQGITKIAAALRVTTVLEGSVRRAGNSDPRDGAADQRSGWLSSLV